MITGKFSEWKSQKQVFSPAIKRAIEHCLKTDFSRVALGKHLIEGDDMFAIVSAYNTEPKEKKNAECHKKMIDIQFVTEGEEAVGISSKSSKNHVIDPYADANDWELYSDVENEYFITLKKDDYVILFPEDVHRPGCVLNEVSPVRKIIIKIKMDKL